MLNKTHKNLGGEMVNIMEVNEAIANQGPPTASVATVNIAHLRQGVCAYWAEKPEHRELVGFPLSGDNGPLDAMFDQGYPVYVGLTLEHANALECWLLDRGDHATSHLARFDYDLDYWTSHGDAV